MSTIEKKEEAREVVSQASEQSGGTESVEEQTQQKERAFSPGIPDLDGVVQSLKARLAETEETLNTLAAKETASEQEKAALMVQLSDKDRKISSLSAQLAQSERELERVTGTLGWRLLSSYGRIKHRYLLPVYRLLRLASFGRGSSTKKHVEHSSFIDTSSPNSQLPQLALVDAQAVPAEVAHTPGEIRPVSDSSTYDIVCFPIIEWDFRFQRPQQLMLRFATAGHRVFYLSQTFRPSGTQSISARNATMFSRYLFVRRREASTPKL
jgi:hypothetical protein